MSARTSIEWTDVTWNPIRGCSRVSEGCRNCYAERQAARWTGPGQPYDGLVSEGKWTGQIRLIWSALDLPLRWRKPRRVFVNSMSDLFHERLPDEIIGRIFDVMAMAEHHTFQVLTKRAARMRDLLARWEANPGDQPRRTSFSNIWLGVSVENQATADKRIPLLLQTPAAVRWVSYEPALESVNLWSFLAQGSAVELRGLDWLVVGGESGPGARPFDVAWARSTIAQGRAAGVPVFVKQLGARPVYDLGDGHTYRMRAIRLRDRKGGKPEEWPEDLRVREAPQTYNRERSP